MKRTILLLLNVLCTTILFSQIPNGGFETWSNKGSYEEPSNWVTTNGLTLLGNPTSVFKSTDAHSGTYACEINVVKVTAKVPGVFIPDYAGSIFTGSQVGANSLWGFPFTFKVTSLGFWYKYNARHGDSATILVATTKWNATLNQRDTISYGYALITDSVGVYTKKELTLFVYDSINSPDSAAIVISAATLSATDGGAKLLLDDMAFEGGNVGLPKTEMPLAFDVYPNPANQKGLQVRLGTTIQNAIVEIMDVNGRLVKKVKQTNETTLLIETNELKPGMYFLSVSNSNGRGIQKLVIE